MTPYSIWHLLGPFKEYVVYLVIALSAFVGFKLYVNSQANNIIAERSAKLLQQTLEENEKIRIELMGLGNRLQELNNKDTKETKNVINNFNKEPNAFDDSTIDGNFVR